jgi:hypothetical protein
MLSHGIYHHRKRHRHRHHRPSQVPLCLYLLKHVAGRTILRSTIFMGMGEVCRPNFSWAFVPIRYITPTIIGMGIAATTPAKRPSSSDP